MICGFSPDKDIKTIIFHARVQIRFTDHAQESMQERRIAQDEVVEAVKRPDRTLKKHGKYYAQKDIGRGIIEVPYERTERYIRIITAYWL